MKNKLNITVDHTLIEQAKRYAAKHETSLSQLVEQYFKGLVRPVRKQNILELLKDLPKPKITVEGDLKETYYNQQKNKYGF
jgi:hypothetical protein